jgi:hypothetical protein
MSSHGRVIRSFYRILMKTAKIHDRHPALKGILALQVRFPNPAPRPVPQMTASRTTPHERPRKTSAPLHDGHGRKSRDVFHHSSRKCCLIYFPTLSMTATRALVSALGIFSVNCLSLNALLPPFPPPFHSNQGRSTEPSSTSVGPGSRQLTLLLGCRRGKSSTTSRGKTLKPQPQTLNPKP